MLVKKEFDTFDEIPERIFHYIQISRQYSEGFTPVDSL